MTINASGGTWELKINASAKGGIIAGNASGCLSWVMF